MRAEPLLACLQALTQSLAQFGNQVSATIWKMTPSKELDWPLMTDTVEKLRITMTIKFLGIFRLPGARTTDQLRPSELRQAGFSYDFCYPLVPTVRNAAQIANKIATLLKTEFFNSIGHNQSIANYP